jgi:hypothetical protein
MPRPPKHLRHELELLPKDRASARCIYCRCTWSTHDDRPIESLSLRTFEGGYRACPARKARKEATDA